MELATPRRHWKRELLVAIIVITVLIVLYANPRELSNAIGGAVQDPAHRASSAAHDKDSSGGGSNSTALAVPIRVLGRLRHKSRANGTAIEWDSDNVVRVLLIFTQARKVGYLREKLSISLGSLIGLSSAPLRIYIVTDRPSANVARQVLADATAKASCDVLAELLHVNDMLAVVMDLVSFLQPVFGSNSGYFHKDLFFLSTGLHRLFARSVRHLILLDVDIQLRSDIALLHQHFALFAPAAIMGLAYEQQPVYRHILHKYRQENHGTKCGEPASRGSPGFNSGVVLLNLEAIRNSSVYKHFLSAKAVQWLAAKYSFRGHLGDQCFYSLLSWEHPELFYVLPCTWNRQLCEWWRHHGYEDVFEEYHRCNGTVHVYHGNCNSSIPSVR